MIRKIVFTIGIVFISQSGICQIERPNKAYGEFEVEVSQSDTAGYIYNYTIKNAEESEQVLVAFSIFIRDNSFYTKSIESPPNKKWYIDGLDKIYITGAAAGKILDLPPENGLSPGEQIEISFNSDGLPAIHPFFTEGFVEPYTEEVLDSLFEAGYKEEEIFINWKDAAYDGHTISPRVWPEAVDTDVFLDSLESYRSRSCRELGWANDPAVCTNVADRLNDVSTSLTAGDSLTAANELAGFINIVETEKNVSLTSEAYALLYFNAQYLLDRLPEPEADDPSVIPVLPAALSIVSGQASGAFGGDNFTISGQNHASGGTPTSGDPVSGILTTTASARQGILNGLQAYQQDNITGSGTAPDVVTGSLGFDAQALIDSVLANVDQTIPANASGTYGSLEEPVVVHATQGIQSSGTISGYGVLLVDGPLQISGTAAWTGLVIQRGMPTVGPATSVSTRLQVTGGMLVVNQGPFGASLQVSNELVIRASSEALQALRDHLEF